MTIRHWILAAAIQAFVLSSALATDWDVTRPRGETRQISFDTSEVTGASVDMSPDKQWLVFDLLANIYRVPASGGAAELLTRKSGIAINFHPRYSPNGEEIVFISDRAGNNHLWIMNADGSNLRQITNDINDCLFDPTWTPDGRKIIARKQDICHRGVHNADGIWMYDSDGGNPTKLVGGRVSSPSVSPDGRYVYYHEGVCSGYTPGHNDLLKGCHQIRRFDLESGNIESVTDGLTEWFWDRRSNGGAIAPRISPDGNWMAFARRSPNGTIDFRGHPFQRSALWVRDLRSGEEIVVMDPIDLDEAEQMAYASPLLPHYGWAPDSSGIVLSQGGKLRFVDLDSGNVQTVAFDAHVSRTISELVRSNFDVGFTAKKSKYIRWPTTAKNGGNAVFQALGKLWIYTGSSERPRRLTSERFTPLEFSPTWSSDGRRLAFSSWDDNDRGAIWVVAAQGGEPKPLTREPGDYLNPVWSRDGKFIVAIKGEGATTRGQRIDENAYFKIVRIDTATGDELELTRISPRKDLMWLQLSTTLDGRVHYLTKPDITGAKPTFLPFEQRPFEARSIAIDGGVPRVHGVMVGPEEYRVSADGRRAVYTKYGQVHLVSLPSPLESRATHPPRIDVANTPLTTDGGVSISWQTRDVIEYASGSDLLTHDVREKKVTRQRAHVRIDPLYGRGTFALINAQLLTMDKAHGNLNGTVVVKNGRIRCVGICDTSNVERVIDVAGQTVMPGIVDAHAHFNRGHGGYSPRQNNLPAANLAYGITTAQDPAALNSAAFSNAELIEAGEMIGPRTYSTGEPLYPWRSDPTFLTSYALVDQEVRRRKAWGAVSLKSFILNRRDQRQWSAEAARKYGLNVTCEAAYLPLNLSLMMDGFTGIEHGLSYNPIVYSDVLMFLAQSKTTISMTANEMGPGPMPMEYYPAAQELWTDIKLGRWLPWREFIPLTRRALKRPKSDYGFALYGEIANDIRDAGANVALGGHGDMQGLSTHWEMWSLAEGMDATDVLEVATIGGARYLGAEKDLGSIKVGKIADLLVLDSSPLDDIRNTADIRFVIKSGIVYDGITLDQIWPQAVPYGLTPWVDEYALAPSRVPYSKWDRADTR